MFTICCTKLKVAVIMACEAVSWSLVSMRIYGPTRGINSQSQESQRRRQSLENVSQLLRNDFMYYKPEKRSIRTSRDGRVKDVVHDRLTVLD